MKNQSSKNSWLIITVIIVLSITVYYLFFAGSAPASNSLLQAQPEGELVGAQVLSLLNQIQSLRIDSTFFQSPAYQSLVDYTVPIPAENVGRANPFAPIPGFVVPAAKK